jgi:hypothetical protein
MRGLFAIVGGVAFCGVSFCADADGPARLFCNELQVGQVGLITVNGRQPVLATAIQVIDDNNAIMEWSSTLHWVQMPTAGMVDDKTYPMNRVMRVTGTKRYTTVLGAQRTILALEAVADAEVIAEPAGAAQRLGVTASPSDQPRQLEGNPDATELQEMIQKLEFELEERNATIAKFRGPEVTMDMLMRRQIPPEHPKHRVARDEAKTITQSLAELRRFQKIGPEKTAVELRERGQKAANQWVLTQTRGGVKRLLEKPALRHRALTAAGPNLTQWMKDAFAEGYLEECERYATAAPPARSP